MSQPIPDSIRQEANEIAAILHGILPEGVGFAMLFFDFGPGGNMSYISDAPRDDMILALKELIVNLESDREN